MAYFQRLKAFAGEESGAVTVDWVVLTAAICFVSISLVATIQRASIDKGAEIGNGVRDLGSHALNEDLYP